MSTMKDLARILALRTKMTQRDSEAFVSDMFDVVKEALNAEGQVKIKGLGMFKLQKVRERESIDVNTGKRVLIASHDRISFTPDTLMKDAVNKPFSHFETVILNDGVSFDDTPEENEAEIPDTTATETTVEDIPESEPVAKDETQTVEPAEPLAEPLTEPGPTEPISEPEPVEVPEETFSEPAEELPEETPTPDETPDVVQDESKDESYEKAAAESHDEPQDEDTVATEDEPLNDVVEEDTDNGLSISWPKILAMTAACFVIFAAGVFVGRVTAPETVKVVNEVPKIVKTIDKDTTTAVAKDTIKATLVAKDSVKTKDAAPKQEAKSEVKSETKAEAKPAVPNNEKYNYDARVRTGAWVIVGTRCVHTVLKGQTLSSLSRFYLGEGMECYVEVYNGDIREVKPGDKLKIPELKNKKQLRK